MSYAVSALILIRLDARMGQWVPLSDLADHLALPQDVVATHLDAMAQEHRLQLQRDGERVEAAMVAFPAEPEPSIGPAFPHLLPQVGF